jgi:ribonuclease HI
MGIEKWATREWKAKSDISKLYIKEFDKLIDKHNINVSFNKIKAHTGDKYNEIADGLAYGATQKAS